VARFVAALTLAVVMLPCFAARLPGDYYNEYHFKYETPHTAWAKPLAGGKVKAFFIAPTHAAREVTELAERLDLEVGGETAMSWNALGQEGTYVSQIEGTSPAEKEESILKKLGGGYDVYVLANFPLTKLPVRLQFEILKAVKEGAGLLLTYRRPALEPMWRHPITEASRLVGEVPLAGLSFYRTTFVEAKKLGGLAEAPAKLVSGFRLGKGRIALVDYGIESRVGHAGGFCLTPHEMFSFRTLTEYDYHQSLVAKALLWAAQREPAVRFVGLPVDGLKLSSERESNEIAIAVENRSAQEVRGTLEITVRNPWGDREFSRQEPLKLAPGSGRVPVKLPQLSGGDHFLDLRLVSKRGVEGWASAALLVASPLEIEAVEVAKPSFEPSEACSGRVKLATACPGDDWSLRVALWDNYGRRFAARSFPMKAGATEAAFSVPLDAAVSLAGRARASLLQGRQVRDTVEQEFFVYQPIRDLFPALVWGNLPGIFGHFAGEQLHRVGFNTILHYYGQGTGEGRRPSTIAREDFHAVPYVTRINWKDGRLGDIAADTKAAEGLRERAHLSMPYAPLVYSLGDENFIPPEGGLHENEHPAFVEFLRGRYQDIGALNAAWGTKYGAFEDAQPIAKSKAAREKQYARYHDTAAFREFLYANWHHYCREVIRGVDPRGRVGAEGSVPGEMELTIKGLEFWGPYRRPEQQALLRSLAPRSLVRGNWFGGYNHGRRDLPSLPRFLWESVLDGSTLLEVYCSYTCENFYNTDLSFAYWMDTFLPELSEITDGLGQLLSASEHACDPVAIYHSQSSVHYEDLSQPFGRYELAHRNTIRLLEDLSYVPYYVTSRGVEAGVLAKQPPRLLILPHAAALSDKEAAAISGFARSGGIVIADVRPGIADERCRAREQGALDGLFGVRRPEGKVSPASAEIRLAAGTTSAGPLKIRTPEGTISNLTTDAGVQLAGGQALGAAGETPVGVVRAVGQGAAVLLNFSLHQYSALAEKDGRRPVFELLHALFEGSGVRPAWQVLDAKGQPLTGGRVSTFRRGGATFVGLLPPRPEDVEKPVAARVRAAESRYLYDLRSGKYLGRADHVKLGLKYTSATLLAALPYEVRGLELAASAKHRAGEALAVKIRLKARGAGRDVRPVFRLNVFGPEGRRRHYYARTLFPEGPVAECAIPFATNDPPGKWRLEARDVASGVRAAATVTLTKGGASE